MWVALTHGFSELYSLSMWESARTEKLSAKQADVGIIVGEQT